MNDGIKQKKLLFKSVKNNVKRKKQTNHKAKLFIYVYLKRIIVNEAYKVTKKISIQIICIKLYKKIKRAISAVSFIGDI